MSISKLIIEAISLTKYATTFENAVYAGIFESMNYNPQPTSLQHKYEFNTELLQHFRNRFSGRLKTSIEQKLLDEIHKIVDPTKFGSISFRSNIGSDGFATTVNKKQVVVIDHKYIDKINDILGRIIYRKFPQQMRNSRVDNSTITQTVSEIVGVYTGQDLKDEIQNNGVIGSAVDEIADVLIHELTHVLQHVPQTDKGIERTEYRSYLSNPKLKKGPNDEFIQLMNDPTTSRSDKWRRLYHASPQEIGAFTHTIIMSIVRSFRLNNAPGTTPSGEPLQPTAFNQVANAIPIFVKQYITPTTPQEHAVFNRYVKFAYKELEQYYEDMKVNPRTKVGRNVNKYAPLPDVGNTGLPPPLPGSGSSSMPPPLPGGNNAGMPPPLPTN